MVDIPCFSGQSRKITLALNTPISSRYLAFSNSFNKLKKKEERSVEHTRRGLRQLSRCERKPQRANPLQSLIQKHGFKRHHTKKLSVAHSLALWSPTTSVLTAATLIYATGAGITAAAGTRSCPPVVSHRGIYTLSISKLEDKVSQAWYSSSLPPTIVDWVIFAPAASLGSVSRL